MELSKISFQLDLDMQESNNEGKRLKFVLEKLKMEVELEKKQRPKEGEGDSLVRADGAQDWRRSRWSRPERIVVPNVGSSFS